MSAKACAYPLDAKALNVAGAAHDLERGHGKPQIGKIGGFEADIGVIDLAMITRDDATQFIDIDCRHQFDRGPRLGMPMPATISSRQLPWHHCIAAFSSSSLGVSR